MRGGVLPRVCTVVVDVIRWLCRYPLVALRWWMGFLETATRWFEDHAGRSDARIVRLGRWRSGLAILSGFLVGIGYHPSWSAWAVEVALGFVVLVLITAPVVLLAMGMLYGVTPAPGRGTVRSGVRASVTTMGLALVTIVPMLVTLIALVALAGVLPWPESPLLAFPLALVYTPLVIVVAITAIFYAVRTTWLLAQSMFSVRAVNPLLAPVCAVVAVALNVALAWVRGDTDGLPPALWLVTSGCGAASVAAVAVAEYRLLRRNGYRWAE